MLALTTSTWVVVSESGRVVVSEAEIVGCELGAELIGGVGDMIGIEILQRGPKMKFKHPGGWLVVQVKSAAEINTAGESKLL